MLTKQLETKEAWEKRNMGLGLLLLLFSIQRSSRFCWISPWHCLLCFLWTPKTSLDCLLTKVELEKRHLVDSGFSESRASFFQPLRYSVTVFHCLWKYYGFIMLPWSLYFWQPHDILCQIHLCSKGSKSLSCYSLLLHTSSIFQWKMSEWNSFGVYKD